MCIGCHKVDSTLNMAYKTIGERMKKTQPLKYSSILPWLIVLERETAWELRVLLAFYFLKSLFHTSSKQTCLAMCHTLRLSGSSNGSTSWHQHQHYSFSFFCKVKKKMFKTDFRKVARWDTWGLGNEKRPTPANFLKLFVDPGALKDPKLRKPKISVVSL